MRVVMDVDPGIDDALALLLAARSSECELVGVTVVAGNVGVDQGTQNALAVLSVAGATGVPVYRGADRPLLRRLTTATHFHGHNGLAGLELRSSRLALGPSAAEFLLTAASSELPPLTVVAVGPLTNLALACRLDASWVSRIARVVVMGGAVTVPGNVTPVAEANFYADPEAAAIVLASGVPITLVGLDVTMKAHLPIGRYTQAHQKAQVSRDPVTLLATSLLDFYVGVAASLGREGPALHDPLAAAVAWQPDLVRTQRARVEVETIGVLSRGQSVAWLSGVRERLENRGEYDDVVGMEPVEGHVDVALEVDENRFLDLFLTRLGLE